jgi:hypothetical protein
VSWLKEARARCEAATSGPWFGLDDGDAVTDAKGETIFVGTLPRGPHNWLKARRQEMCDRAVFTAAARTDLPRALDVIAELAAALRAIPEDVKRLHADGCRYKEWTIFGNPRLDPEPPGCTCHHAKVRAALALVEGT